MVTKIFQKELDFQDGHVYRRDITKTSTICNNMKCHHALYYIATPVGEDWGEELWVLLPVHARELANT